MKNRILVSVLVLAISFGAARAKGNGLVNILPAGTPHNILSSQLPRALLADIKRDYKDYWISELYEEGENKRPSYFITMENADQSIKLSATDSENWVIVSTTIKP